jgi:hypothetical protein
MPESNNERFRSPTNDLTVVIDLWKVIQFYSTRTKDDLRAHYPGPHLTDYNNTNKLNSYPVNSEVIHGIDIVLKRPKSTMTYGELAGDFIHPTDYSLNQPYYVQVNPMLQKTRDVTLTVNCSISWTQSSESLQPVMALLQLVYSTLLHHGYNVTLNIIDYMKPLFVDSQAGLLLRYAIETAETQLPIEHLTGLLININFIRGVLLETASVMFTYINSTCGTPQPYTTTNQDEIVINMNGKITDIELTARTLLSQYTV